MVFISLTLTMTLHLHCSRLWPILCPLSGALCTCKKVYIIRSSTWPAVGINLSSVVPQVCQWKLPLKKSPQGSHWHSLQNQGINLVALCMILRVLQYKTKSTKTGQKLPKKLTKAHHIPQDKNNQNKIKWPKKSHKNPDDTRYRTV